MLDHPLPAAAWPPRCPRPSPAAWAPQDLVFLLVPADLVKHALDALQHMASRGPPASGLASNGVHDSSSSSSSWAAMLSGTSTVLRVLHLLLVPLEIGQALRTPLPWSGRCSRRPGYPRRSRSRSGPGARTRDQGLPHPLIEPPPQFQQVTRLLTADRQLVAVDPPSAGDRPGRTAQSRWSGNSSPPLPRVRNLGNHGFAPPRFEGEGARTIRAVSRSPPQPGPSGRRSYLRRPSGSGYVTRNASDAAHQPVLAVGLDLLHDVAPAPLRQWPLVLERDVGPRLGAQVHPDRGAAPRPPRVCCPPSTGRAPSASGAAAPAGT